MHLFSRFILLAGYLLLSIGTSVAATPLVTIKPILSAPTKIPYNGTAMAIYQVTNNTKSLKKFQMQSMSGIAIITGMKGGCHDPIQLNSGESCLLNLNIVGYLLPAHLEVGPVICPQPFTGYGCSRPSSPAEQLNITRTAPDLFDNSNTWIKVLVADDEAPPDQTTYVNKINRLAPNLEQIHLRVAAGANGCSSSSLSACQVYVNLINALREAYQPRSILIGYHPDDSKSSYENWGCDKNDPNAWQCVLNASILVMNAINSIADPHQTGTGFNIFSLEQSYAIGQDAPTLRIVKSCLNPAQAGEGIQCPDGVAIALPVVSFGWVLPSYGGCVPSPEPCDNQYGPDALDYGYPQYYNQGEKINDYTALIETGFLPKYSTGCMSTPLPSPLYVVDEDNGAKPYNPEIPCTTTGQTTSNVFTYPDPTSGQPPNISLATAYLSYILTQLPPIADLPDTNGSPVYLMFSGEGVAQAPSLFLGAPGWTLESIYEFYQGINANFDVLYKQYPPEDDPMFKHGVFSQGVNPQLIQYGIWNFSSILDNMPD